MPTITDTRILTVIYCYKCGVPFAWPKDLDERAHEQGAAVTFYCPNGHGQVYGNSENARLQRELAAAKQRELAERESRFAEERRHEATQKQLRKERKRTAAGVCPCCQRTFTNMARHLKTKHPEHVTETLGEKGKLPS